VTIFWFHVYLLASCWSSLTCLPSYLKEPLFLFLSEILGLGVRSRLVIHTEYLLRLALTFWQNISAVQILALFLSQPKANLLPYNFYGKKMLTWSFHQWINFNYLKWWILQLWPVLLKVMAEKWWQYKTDLS
jgi:hypothetical protein